MELLSEAADNASAMDVDNAASPSQRNASQQQPTSILRQRGQPTPGRSSVTWNPSQAFTPRQQSSQPPPLVASSSTAGAAMSIRSTPRTSHKYECDNDKFNSPSSIVDTWIDVNVCFFTSFHSTEKLSTVRIYIYSTSGGTVNVTAARY